MSEWIVTEQNSGQSLQGFLKTKFIDSSAKAIKRSIDSGNCTLNGQIERFSSRLVGKGDVVKFTIKEKITSSKDRKYPVIYSDQNLLAIDKPSGISSESIKLLEILQAEFGFVKLLHRLDKETSGVLLFARNEAFAKDIEQLFKERKIDKTYLAIVDGNLKEQSGVVDNYLGKLKVYQGQTLMGIVSQEEKNSFRAVTNWQVLKSGKMASLLIVRPKTGRMHQIRVHLSSLSHPIIGDYQYGKRFKCQYRPERLLLHASEISFLYPNTQKHLLIKADIPIDFEKAIQEIIENHG